MKSSPNTPDGQNGPTPRPALSPAMRLGIFITVMVVAAVLIETQASKNVVDVALEPPFDASVMHKPGGHKTSAGAGRVIFVPNNDGQLRRVTIKEALPPASTTDAGKAYMSSAAFAMKHLLQEAPAEFPAGTRLLAVKVDQGKKTVSVDLSKEFTTPGFWQGSTRTLATVYAVVNTLAAVNPTVANKVQFLVEGKPADLLGEFDASEPLEPDNKLVASS